MPKNPKSTAEHFYSADPAFTMMLELLLKLFPSLGVTTRGTEVGEEAPNPSELGDTRLRGLDESGVVPEGCSLSDAVSKPLPLRPRPIRR